MKLTINQLLSQQIKKLRVEKDMTQEELAEKIETSYKYLQRIEGKNPPDLRISTVEKIAKALQVKVSKLIK